MTLLESSFEVWSFLEKSARNDSALGKDAEICQIRCGLFDSQAEMILENSFQSDFSFSVFAGYILIIHWKV